ncbi:MAG: ABC transporter permease [Chloroflexi bacterium]|nr:ABC transporter permease [Chloroflexota bacterium]
MFTITLLTLHEALRKRVLLLALVLGLGFVAIYAIGVNYIYSGVTTRGPAPTGINAPLLAMTYVTMAGLYAVNFLMVMMSALMPVDTLSGEIRSGAIQTLVTKPVHRLEIVLGKWLGFWLILAGYLLLTAGGVLAVVFAISRYVPPNIAVGLPLMLLEGTVLLTLSIAGGTRLSTLANGVLVFGLYGLAFIGGWVEQIGALLGNDATSQVGIVVSLLIPSDVLWQLATYNMQPAFFRDATVTPFTPASVPSPAMVWWALGYIFAGLLVAVRSFSRRDL